MLWSRSGQCSHGQARWHGWLRQQPALVEEQRGALLLRHCPPEAPCHADVLLAELGQQGSGAWRPFYEEQQNEVFQFGPGKPIRYLGSWYQTFNFDNLCKDIGQSRETSMLLWTAMLL